jgi:hypothetical protein
MYYLIYISTAIKLMNQQELCEILTVSRKNNVQNDITGILLYSEGIFLQALEGSKSSVNEVYSKIEKDQRHKNLIMLITGESDNRMFPNWSMAFIAIEPTKMAEIEGYINPLKKQLFKGKATTSAMSILKTFADSNNLSFTD